MVAPLWNSTGYDMAVGDRWLYAIATGDRRQVKVGLVLREERIPRRVTELRRKYKMPDLELVAQCVLRDVNHPQAEHLESVVRHWLCGRAGFTHNGRVDWLDTPVPQPTDWSRLLEEAVDAARSFGR